MSKSKDYTEELEKGLQNKIPSNMFEDESPSVPVAKRMMNARLIPLRLIDRDPTKTRKEFDIVKLKELTDSIRQHGVIQPISVRELDTNNIGLYEKAGRRDIQPAC